MIIPHKKIMNFDVPASVPEREPRFPSLEEIHAKLVSLCGHENPAIERTNKDEEGNILLHEMVVTDEAGNDTLYTYQRAGERSGATTISASVFLGKVADDICVDAEHLATYDESTGKWRDTHEPDVLAAIPEISIEIAQARETDPKSIGADADVQAVFNELLGEGKIRKLREVETAAVASVSAPMAVNQKIALQETFGSLETVEAKRAALITLFDDAEAAYTNASVNPEETDAEIAKEARKIAKPILDLICTILVSINQSESQENRDISWNPKDNLTEEQFNELNLRRMRLSNTIGMLYKDTTTGKTLIRHDLNDIS